MRGTFSAASKFEDDDQMQLRKTKTAGVKTQQSSRDLYSGLIKEEDQDLGTPDALSSRRKKASAPKQKPIVDITPMSEMSSAMKLAQKIGASPQRNRRAT